MKPNKETIDEFKRIFKEEFGEELDDKTAYDRFTRLTNFLRVIYYPDKTLEK